MKNTFTLPLKDGQIARVRRTRLYWPEPKIGEWQDEALMVDYFNGAISTLSLKSLDWAEYDPRGYEYEGVENGIHKFIAEDYMLEIDEASLT